MFFDCISQANRSHRQDLANTDHRRQARLDALSLPHAHPAAEYEQRAAEGVVGDGAFVRLPAEPRGDEEPGTRRWEFQLLKNWADMTEAEKEAFVEAAAAAQFDGD